MNAWMKINKKYLGIGMLAVLVPFLTASEKSFKSIVDEWFETCSIVVEMEDLTADGDKVFYPINLFVQGDPPETAHLVVSSDKAIFTQLIYRHSLSSNNRSLHPGTPQTSIGGPNKNISVPLTPFRKNLLYSFRAYTNKKNIDDKTLVGAFVKFPKETEAQVCRVEKDTWFNALVGGSSAGRFIFVLILVFVLSISITLLRAKQE